MTPAIQDTLLQLFEHVRQDPDTLPTVPIDRWQEGSAEWRLLSGFQVMLEQVQQRMHQFMEMELQLREREEQYRGVFEATYDGLIILDLDGFYVEVNPAYCSMFGYTREELMGMHSSILTAPEALPSLADALKTLKTGRGFQTVGQGLRKDGTAFYAEASGTTFTYRGKPHVLGVSRDITERVQAQHLLEQRVEERTRELSSLQERIRSLGGVLQIESASGKGTCVRAEVPSREAM